MSAEKLEGEMKTDTRTWTFSKHCGMEAMSVISKHPPSAAHCSRESCT